MIIKTLNELKTVELKPIKSGHFLDKFYSSIKNDETSKGLTPSSINLIWGGPGAGKSTLLLSYLASFQEKGYNCCYISSEMNQARIKNIQKIVSNINIVPTVFLSEWENEELNPEKKSPLEILSYIFNIGFDVILIDSYEETKIKVKNTINVKITQKDLDSILLNLIKKASEGYNEKSTKTSFLLLQHMTKSGNSYIGTSSLEHYCDSSMFIEFIKKGINVERYFKFNKNRFSDFIDKCYFKITNEGVVLDDFKNKIGINDNIEEELEQDKKFLLEMLTKGVDANKENQ